MQLGPNRELILGEEKCWSCNATGMQPGRKRCPSCGGTRRGPRGGRDGCRACSYDGTVSDPANPRPCGACKGTAMRPEQDTSCVPQEWLDAMPIRVVRAPGRAMSWGEQYLGAGLYSVVDYGRHKALSDDALAADVRRNLRHVQACKLLKDGRVAGGVAVVTAASGYSVLADPTTF